MSLKSTLNSQASFVTFTPKGVKVNPFKITKHNLKTMYCNFNLLSRESALSVHFTTKMDCENESDSITISDIYYNKLAFGDGGGSL